MTDRSAVFDHVLEIFFVALETTIKSLWIHLLTFNFCFSLATSTVLISFISAKKMENKQRINKGLKGMLTFIFTGQFRSSSFNLTAKALVFSCRDLEKDTKVLQKNQNLKLLFDGSHLTATLRGFLQTFFEI